MTITTFGFGGSHISVLGWGGSADLPQQPTEDWRPEIRRALELKPEIVDTDPPGAPSIDTMVMRPSLAGTDTPDTPTATVHVLRPRLTDTDAGLKPSVSAQPGLKPRHSTDEMRPQLSAETEGEPEVRTEEMRPSITDAREDDE